MAMPQNQKRRHGDDLSRDLHPIKKIKLRGHHHSSNFSPEFWDNLSKVPLTPRALRELDRRNSIRPPTKLTTPEAVYSKDLARFARHGGPDLRHLREYPEPKLLTCATVSGRSSKSSSSSRHTQTTDATSAPPSKKKSHASSRGPDFEQHLNDHGIYLEGDEYPDDRGTPEPSNLDEIHQGLLATRASLSPSRFPDSAIRDFKRKNARVVLEDDVMNEIVPVLCGNATISSKKNVVFTELKPITNENATRPKPDFFDGARLRDINTTVRSDEHMYSMIIPTKHPTVPVAPNMFLEAKRQDGSAAVMKRQACYDGAYGARAMHSLQNYGNEEPVYDNNAYTFSSTYHAGTSTLQLYTHHPTVPTAPGERPEYHMTQLDSYGLTGNPRTFRDGVAAFRNARDMAGQHRDNFIAAANTYALQANVPVSHAEPQHLLSEEEPYRASTALDYDNSSTSFATTSSGTNQTFKRPRQSHSPLSSSADSHLAKSRTRYNASRRGMEANGLHWVSIYWREAKLCFTNPEGQEVETEKQDWVGKAVDGSQYFHWRSPRSGRAFWHKD